MGASAWPVYRGFAVRDLRMLGRFVADSRRLRHLTTVVLLFGLYAAGLVVRIPGIPTSHLTSPPERWWFLILLDLALTGGALGRGCVFSLGILGPLLLGSSFGTTRSPLATYARQVVGLSLAVLFVGLTLRARGLVASGPRPLILVCLVVAFGGIALKMIDTHIVRLHGPSVLYINLLMVLVVSLRATFTTLSTEHHYLTSAMVVACIAFISISAYFLMRTRILVEVENIGDQSHRRATLEIPAMDEPMIDSLSIVFLTLYVCIAGFISLMLGWHSITSQNAPVFSVLALAAFALSWIIFLVVSRYFDVFEVLGAAGSVGFSDPRGYAIRMLNNFWIAPGFKAGRTTEALIKSRLANKAKASFLLFASWFVVSLSLEYMLARISPSAVLFPFGPVVFIFVLVMLVGNASAILRHLSSALSHFKQLLRGESRLLAEMYPLGKADQQGRISLDQDFQQYWEEQRLSDQLHDMLGWLKLAREVQMVRKPAPTRRGRLRTAMLHLAMRLLFGVILSFVVGVVCLMLFPDISRKDIGLIVVPIILTTVIAPDAVIAVLRRSGNAT